MGGALDAQTVAALCFRALFWNLDASPTGEVVAGHRPFRGHDLLGWTVGHDGPALKASSRAEVAQPIGLAERVFVVFDHHEGVAEVGQFPQGFEQALIVPLMQSNGRFVKHVHHACETRADLGGQPNPLAFAARQRVGPAVEGQVIETNAVKEREARLDFFEDLSPDEEAAFIQHFGAVGPRLRRARFSVGPPRADQ